jgi:hypothetical protein
MLYFVLILVFINIKFKNSNSPFYNSFIHQTNWH